MRGQEQNAFYHHIVVSRYSRVSAHFSQHLICRVQEIVTAIDIPLRSSNKRIHFLETLHALVGRVAGAEVPADDEFVIHNKLVSKLPKDAVVPKYSVGDLFCAMYVKTSIQGFLTRMRVRVKGLRRATPVT